jgi:hypothetical protein
MLKLRGLSPRANYTDRATASLSAKLMPMFADRGCRVSAADPYGSNVGFSRPEPLLFLLSNSSFVLMRLSGHAIPNGRNVYYINI